MLIALWFLVAYFYFFMANGQSWSDTNSCMTASQKCAK
jgi:hypothetical protein